MNLPIATLVEQAQLHGADRIKILEKEDYTALLLADGAGGMSGAQEAAEYIIQSLEKQYEGMSKVPHIDTLEPNLRNLDRALQREQYAGNTTCVLIFITEQEVYGVSVGDSRCWLYTDLFQLELTAHQYKQPVLGTGNAVPVAFGPFEKNGTLLIGSDGVFDYLKKSVIDSIIEGDSDLAEKPKLILQATKETNSRLMDDISIVICQLQ